MHNNNHIQLSHSTYLVTATPYSITRLEHTPSGPTTAVTVATSKTTGKAAQARIGKRQSHRPTTADGGANSPNQALVFVTTSVITQPSDLR